MSGYLLDVADEDLDSARFTAQVAAAHAQAADGGYAAAAATLRAALGLWRGPVAHGARGVLVRNTAAALEEARMSAAEELVRLELKLGRHLDITGDLQALLTEHPWRERLYAYLMLALYRSGRQAEALEVYRQAWTILTTEVGVEPGQELRELAGAVANRDPALQPRPARARRGSATAPTPSVLVPRQLPPTVADFVGRDQQITAITRLLVRTAPQVNQPTGPLPAAPTFVPIVALSGRGGAGASTLALHIGHLLSGSFPDGQLYVDFRGGAGDDTSAVLACLLRALGIPNPLIPEQLAERVQLYRSQLATRRLFLLLDNVTGEDQVGQLLPGSSSCAVLVTGRPRLTGLAGARLLDLDGFDEQDSLELLTRIVGAERIEAEPAAAAEVVRCCTGLPLALRIAGSRLAARPHWQVADLAVRLKNDARRLDELHHRGMSVRASIDQAYRQLSAVAGRLLRLVALVEVAEFPGWIAAVLLDTDHADVEDALDQLVQLRLLDAVRRHGELVYRIDDLSRAYAQERLAEVDADPERRAASERMLREWDRRCPATAPGRAGRRPPVPRSLRPAADPAGRPGPAAAS